MAKTKSQSQVAQPGRGARESDAERWNRILIIGGVVAVVLVAIGFIGFGWYQTQISPLGKTVLRVGETKFNLAHLERRMRLMREENPFFAQPGQSALLLPDSVLAQLEREAKLLEGASELNLTVSEEEVAQRVRERGNLAEEVEASLFAAEFRRQVESSRLKENEYRQMLRAQLLEEKVRAYFAFLAPKAEPQVRARWLVRDERDQAEVTLQRLEAGEDFDTVAQDVSPEATGAGQGGELDWAPRGGSAFLPDDVEDFLFEAEPGERSGIISVGNFYYIAELLEQDDDRALDEQQREQVANRQMSDWIQGLDNTLDIERDFTDEDLGKALGDVF